MVWRESEAIQAGALICRNSIGSHYTKGKVYPLEKVRGVYHVYSDTKVLHSVRAFQELYNNSFIPHIVQLEND